MTLHDHTDRTILVVDDEANIRELCSIYLEREGYTVNTAEDGESALEVARTQSPDLIVLDLMLPKKSGYEVTRELRADPGSICEVPILMLTARSEDVDRIVGLELGADDYLVKPFHPRELTARVKAILRRASASADRDGLMLNVRGRISVGPLALDWDRREASLHGAALTLRNKEFELLRRLAEYSGIVLTREQLLEHVWGYEYFGETRTVDVHINQLRRKLSPDGSDPGVAIETVRGVGYKLVETGG
ncbi:MAG: response regulator transcription factor [Chloroflexi bacterium]|nr:response regulator transcription factor [Chloroflexota bacterium]MYF23590.1 response regulator transcription factor [Chloroflexota bacterium]